MRQNFKLCSKHHMTVAEQWVSNLTQLFSIYFLLLCTGKDSQQKISQHSSVPKSCISAPGDNSCSPPDQDGQAHKTPAHRKARIQRKGYRITESQNG